MSTLKIACAACGGTWSVPGNWSDYEREMIESRPCPACGAITLGCPAPSETQRSPLVRNPLPRLRELFAARVSGLKPA